MIDERDPFTPAALRELVRLTAEARAPILLWVGAGASRWNGYPGWIDLAEQMHLEFVRECPSYEPVIGGAALAKRDLPRLFSIAKASDAKRYARRLLHDLRPRAVSPVYGRFVRALSALNPAAILTTNVDESLDLALP